MRMMRCIIERTKARLKEKYVLRLLTDRIRLAEVPEWLRMDRSYTHSIHVAAFRVDRGTSRKRYMEDLAFVEIEIIMAKAQKHPDLQRALEGILEQAESCMDLIRENGEE